MPSVAQGVVYAVNNGAMEARDEMTGDLLWNWTSPEDSLRSPMIVSKTHVIACTDDNTYTIEILSRESDWSYPASGYLSLGNDTLYIAGSNGLLTAIATPEYIPATPVKLKIEGPSDVFESSTNAYQATVTYSDGRIRNRTVMCNWTVTEQPWCVFDQGMLNIGELLYPQEAILLNATYTQDETTITDELEVTIHVNGTAEELVARNLEKAMQSKHVILYELQQAMMYERASSDIVDVLKHSPVNSNSTITRPELNKALNQIDHAIAFEGTADKSIQTSVENLKVAMEIFAPDSPYWGMIQKYMTEQIEQPEQPYCPEADITGDCMVDLLDFTALADQWLVGIN